MISQVRNSTTHVTLSHTNLVQTTLRLPKSRVIPFFIPINHRWTRQGVTHNLSMFSPTFDITFLPAWEHWLNGCTLQWSRTILFKYQFWILSLTICYKIIFVYFFYEIKIEKKNFWCNNSILKKTLNLQL